MTGLVNLLAPTQGIAMTVFVPMGKNNGTAQLAPVKLLLELFPPLAPMTAYVATVRKLGTIIRVPVRKQTYQLLAPMTAFAATVRKLGIIIPVLVRKPTYPRLAPMTAYVAMVQKLGIIILVLAILFPPY
jgi:hypothetical protein